MRLTYRFIVIFAFLVVEDFFGEGIMSAALFDRHIEITPGVLNGNRRITSRQCCRICKFPKFILLPGT